MLILENFVIHRNRRGRELAEKPSVEVLFLSAHSPDLKANTKRAEARLLAALSVIVKEALDAVTLASIQSFFRGCGYNAQYLMSSALETGANVCMLNKQKLRVTSQQSS